jgi:hypothetical protein
MLVVIAVIVILVTMVIGIAARIDAQSKIQLTKNTFALLDAALGQFQDYGYSYKVPSTAGADEMEFYRSLDFPIDCNGLSDTDLENAFELAPGITNVSSISGGRHDSNYSGSETLYFFLSRVSECRKTLDKIDTSLLTSKDKFKQDITITIDGKSNFLIRFIDPFGETLRYDYYDEKETFSNNRRLNTKKTFPVIISAGPDKEFDTADDIKSR